MADVERFTCGLCGDALLPQEIVGHMAAEGRAPIGVLAIVEAATEYHRLVMGAASEVDQLEAWCVLDDVLGGAPLTWTVR